jgi:hypothetical protein
MSHSTATPMSHSEVAEQALKNRQKIYEEQEELTVS